MTEIKLTQGFTAIIDDEDAEAAQKFKWRVLKGRKTNYAMRHTKTIDGRDTNQLLHRFIGERMGLGNPAQIDHEDRNGLNCCRGNLRPSNGNQNQGNRGRNRDNTSGYKGVYWFKKANKWAAQIGIRGGVKGLGLFTDPEAAARVYDEWAKAAFGEFACVNFSDHRD